MKSFFALAAAVGLAAGAALEQRWESTSSTPTWTTTETKTTPTWTSSTPTWTTTTPTWKTTPTTWWSTTPTWTTTYPSWNTTKTKTKTTITTWSTPTTTWTTPYWTPTTTTTVVWVPTTSTSTVYWTSTVYVSTKTVAPTTTTVTILTSTVAVTTVTVPHSTSTVTVPYTSTKTIIYTTSSLTTGVCPTATAISCPNTCPPPPPPPQTTTYIPPTTTPPPKTTTPTPTPTPTPSSGCPVDLKSGSLTPSLIIPINSSSPNTSYGTQYFGEIGMGVSSIFNFDVPQSLAGKTCALVFAFPTQQQLSTSSYTISGSGAASFDYLSSPATSGTTYANAPKSQQHLGSANLQPGSATTIATYPCPAGKTVAVEASSISSYYLKFFEDYNPCPIGLFIIPQ